MGEVLARKQKPTSGVSVELCFDTGRRYLLDPGGVLSDKSVKVPHVFNREHAKRRQESKSQIGRKDTSINCKRHYVQDPLGKQNATLPFSSRRNIGSSTSPG